MVIPVLVKYYLPNFNFIFIDQNHLSITNRIENSLFKYGDLRKLMIKGDKHVLQIIESVEMRFIYLCLQIK